MRKVGGFFAVAAALLVAGACGGSKSTGSVDKDAGTGGAGGTSGCKTSLDCSTNQVCDKASGHCVDCLTDNDCKSGDKCVGNVCRPPCTSDKDCTPLGLLCDTSNGACVQCIQAKDCTGSEFCASGVCKAQVCEPGKSTCQGNAIATCSADGSSLGAPAPCGGAKVCVQLSGGPICEEPDAGTGGTGGMGGTGGTGGTAGMAGMAGTGGSGGVSGGGGTAGTDGGAGNGGSTGSAGTGGAAGSGGTDAGPAVPPLLVSDGSTDKIYALDKSGSVLDQYTSPVSGVRGVAHDLRNRDGFWVAGTGDPNAFYKVAWSGNLQKKLALSSAMPASPRGLAYSMDTTGDMLYVIGSPSSKEDDERAYDLAGNDRSDGLFWANGGPLAGVWGLVAVGRTGFHNLDAVAWTTWNDNTLQLWKSSASFSQSVGTSLTNLKGIGRDASGDFWVVAGTQIAHVDPAGTTLGTFAAPGPDPEGLSYSP